eukprot:1053693-Prymnesium_polylepis.1
MWVPRSRSWDVLSRLLGCDRTGLVSRVACTLSRRVSSCALSLSGSGGPPSPPVPTWSSPRWRNLSQFR